MKIRNKLAPLLHTYMKRVPVGDARLASQVNSIMSNPYFIHRSTLRNWRDGSSQKVHNWRQLIVVAAALNLSRHEANKLLEAGRCPPLSALMATTKESDHRLFNHWGRKLEEEVIRKH